MIYGKKICELWTRRQSRRASRISSPLTNDPGALQVQCLEWRFQVIQINAQDNLNLDSFSDTFVTIVCNIRNPCGACEGILCRGFPRLNAVLMDTLWFFYIVASWNIHAFLSIWSPTKLLYWKIITGSIEELVQL